MNPTNTTLVRTASAAGRLSHFGNATDGSIADDMSGTWIGADPWALPPVDPYLSGYVASAHGTPVAGMPPHADAPAALAESSAPAFLGTTSSGLTMVLYLQEPGTSAPISVTDINQGQMGDCYLLSSIGEIALLDPGWITQMIHANSDGTETVTLYEASNGGLPTIGTTGYKAVSINVTNSFPSNSVNNGATQDVYGGQKEIWVQVLEKAMATLYGGYNGIANGGIPSISMEELTGCAASSMSAGAISLRQLQSDVTAGDLITFDTENAQTLPYGLFGDHAYMFDGLSTVNGTVMVDLLNPWGFDDPNPVPFSLIDTVCDEVDVGRINALVAGPSLIQQTANQTWAQGSHVSLTLPAGTFSEPSGGKLTCMVTQANGQACPSWLSFNATTLTFSGTVPSGMEALSLVVTATDANGLSCTDCFAVTVPAVPPTLSHQTAAQSWLEGAQLSFTLPSNTFADPNGETLSYSATLSNGQALPSWLAINSNSGAFTGTVGYTSGLLLIKVTATDTSGLSVSETLQATLVAPAPTIKDQTANQTWTAGKVLSFILPSGTFATVPGQTLTYTATLPAGLTINATTGTISGTVPVTIGVNTLQVTATETSGLSVSETFLASIVASAPVATQTPAQTWTANRPISFTLPANSFVDPQGETLTYTVTGLPTGLSFNPTTLTISGSTVTQSSFTVKVTAKDQSGLSASDTFQAAIVASAPTARQMPLQTWTANKGVALSVASAFADPQGESFTYAAILSNGNALPSGLTFNATTGSFGGIAPAAPGALAITVTAKDQSGLSASETFQCLVTAFAPTAISQPAGLYWAANEAVTFTLPPNAFVDPQGETMSYAATTAGGMALPGWLKFNTATGAFTGTAPVTPQSLELSVTATDLSGLSVNETFQVTVEAAAPTVANPTGAQIWGVDKAVSFTLPGNTFVDPQGEKLTLSATLANGLALPGGLTFNASYGTFGGTAPITPETLGLKVTATDSSGLSVSDLFSATVQAGAPTLAHQIGNQIWTDGSSMSFLLPANTFIDPQGAALSYAAFETSGPNDTSWLHFSAGLADFTGSVPTGLGGTIGIEVVATDVYGLSTSESFGLTFGASGAHLAAAAAPSGTELLALHG
jgi:hypothetical protein